MLGCGVRKGDVGRGIRGRGRKVCWGVGEVRGDVGKGEVREEMWGSVLGSHILTHFSTPPPFFSPHPFPTCQHTSHSPQIFLYLPPHPNTFPYTSPHTSSHSSPDLPLHPNTLPHSPHALSPHLPPQFRLCGEVTMHCM